MNNFLDNCFSIKKVCLVVVAISMTVTGLGVHALAKLPVGNKDPSPDYAVGASTYVDRCAQCHGTYGMGEGVIPLILGVYPNTNLFEAKHLKSLGDSEALRDMIIYGGTKKGVSDLMPPWGNELTWTEIESLVLFLGKMSEGSASVRKQLEKTTNESMPTVEYGRKLFLGRCVNCHGRYGEGNGRLSKIITKPPPSNLRLSEKPDAYLKSMISKGGGAMKRSESMPSWGDELTSRDIDALVMYIRSLGADIK